MTDREPVRSLSFGQSKLRKDPNGSRWSPIPLAREYLRIDHRRLNQYRASTSSATALVKTLAGVMEISQGVEDPWKRDHQVNRL